MKQGGTTTNIVPGRSRNVLTGDFFYASSDENAVLAQAFEEHRDNLRNSQRVFLIVYNRELRPIA